MDILTFIFKKKIKKDKFVQSLKAEEFKWKKKKKLNVL